ncbi:MMPL family transporter [Actinophytocola algeriensis]|uniref:RND superfamily putative drug exporter n=1 Tax=Actinophytocola algeriensis TaxID=1768010 RepID=A0A7W7VGL9_9PSEU|nr:MMPL family transporter [Actinophytocola algeriensis]MBB4909567.1 RND superfamily putative drug exporter [Actinophytocola algeriensis]MBE1475557.1 RND superfamily putative drug exporter [Actinophytocola algeriensis]
MTSPSRFVRLAGWAGRRHWLALALWVLVLGGITVAAQAVGSAYRDDHSLPGTESQQVADAFAARGQQPDAIQVVFQRDDGIAGARAGADAVLSEVERLPRVADVQPLTVSERGSVAFATVTLDGADVPAEDVRRIIDTAQRDGDLRVELGGDPVRGAEESAGGAAEGAGILAALVILVLMFGSFLAACLPLVTAVFAVGSTLGVIMLASQFTALPSYAPPLMMLVGLGVGIDYALLIFARYRGELHRGADREAAARTALDTAGRSVLFAGCTVMIALLGLLALGLGSLQGVALAVTLTVLLTMIASLTLLPALLTVFGKRIERAVRKRPNRGSGVGWRRWSDTVQRRPVPALVVSLAALGALSVPALGMQLGFADAGTESADATSRQAYDLLADGFGPGVNGPLVLMSDGGGTEELAAAVERTDGVARVGEPQRLGGDLGMLLAFPDSAPQDTATSDLVTRLRTDVLPPLEAQTGATYLVGGSTAAADDFAAAVADRLPLFLLVVVGLSALLLMAVFRSLLIPLKAAVLNLLSIGASLGVVTLVFAPTGPVEAFVPVLVFAIVFGLSMDYEVFLVSRMHEEWRRTGDATRAVREGLAATGGVITAAAAIMIVVFGAFVLSPDRMLQQFGLGLAVAVLVDALVIRCLVVPAVMRLFGARAWWLPRWLDKALPTVALEPPELHAKTVEFTRSNKMG